MAALSLVAGLGAGLGSAAMADTPSYGPMSAALTPTLRAAVVVVLKGLGEGQPDRIVDSARTFQRLNCAGQQAFCYVRIEDSHYCEADRCLTLVMSTAPNVFKPLTMFYAGPTGGLAEPQKGVVRASDCFWTAVTTVCVSETPMGWIVH